MINDLEAAWQEIESKKAEGSSEYVKMVCPDLLCRVYIGITGIPSKRYIIFEIPEAEKHQFDAFVEPKGFKLSLEETVVKHSGYVSCIMQASSSANNDVFSIVVSDIIDAVRSEDDPCDYVQTLRETIEKWREFFRSAAQKILSDKQIIGLFGDLSFLKQAMEAGVDFAPDMWNGPLRAPQDFQGEKTAVEIKSVSTNVIKSVHISNEAQLDNSKYDRLYLSVYRIERNDKKGVTLPELAENIASAMIPARRKRFYAKLTCGGYDREKAVELYTRGYLVRENVSYRVEDDFPKIARDMLPAGISEVEYILNLQACENSRTSFESVLESVKEG